MVSAINPTVNPALQSGNPNVTLPTSTIRRRAARITTS